MDIQFQQIEMKQAKHKKPSDKKSDDHGTEIIVSHISPHRKHISFHYVRHMHGCLCHG